MKLALKIIIGFIVLLVLAVVLLITLVNPNQFKPRIEALAAQQGIALHLNGDLGWSFWPSLGVQVEEISAAPLLTPDQPIAELREASLLLALMPLFKGDFQVDHVAVNGAHIYLRIDKSGKGNWESITQEKKGAAPAPEPEQTGEAKPLTLEIEHVSLQDSALEYRDEQSGQAIAVSDLNLDLTDVNTLGEPFQLALSWLLEMTATEGGEKLQLKGSLHNNLVADKNFNAVQLTDGKLELRLTQKSSVEIPIDYSLALNNLQGDMNYQGSFNIASLNLRQLLAALGTKLETADNNALEKFAFSGTVKGSTTQVAVNSLKLQLDRTNVGGTVAITDFAAMAIKADLQGDTINVDSYLAPEQEGEQKAASSSEDTPLPLEMLRELNADIHLTLNEMQIKKMRLSGIDLRVVANNGDIKQTLKAQAYEGKLDFDSQLQALARSATLRFDGGMQGFQIAPLLKDMKKDEKLKLSGALQMNAQGTTSGATVNQLVDGMNATANFSGAQVRMAPLNIEEQFCKLVNLVTQASTPDVSWDDYTEMRALDGKIQWRDQVISLEGFNAGVSQLLLAGSGAINLAQSKYDIKLPIKLAVASETASVKGCTLGTDNYWVNRSLSLLRCKGSFDDINPAKDCGFDKSALTGLTKDFAEYKIRQKHGDKIDAAEQKLKDKKQELLDKANEKLGGEGSVSKPKDLLGNLFKKKLGVNNSASSAATPTENSSAAASAAPSE